MVFKSFRLNCTVRVAAICVTIALFFYLLLQTRLIATTIIVGVLILLQVIALLWCVEKTNRDLARFLESIKYSDFSQAFSSSIKGASFEKLNAAFQEVLAEFQRIRREKEEHFRYLQTVVQHVGTGLIAFSRDGEVALINNAAKRLLQIPHLKNISGLGAVSEEIAAKLPALTSGEKLQIKLSVNGDVSQLSIHATEFILRQQKYTLISLQNIKSELEEKEMEAWQTLIRILTHEIMNSITPISSLASTANSILTSEMAQEPMRLDRDVRDDVVNAVRTIEKRSEALMTFVENYRKLTRIPKPSIKVIQMADLFERVASLMKEQIEQSAIDCRISIVPESLKLNADPVLIEQVLINLCKNAVEAVAEKSQALIELTARSDKQGKPVIQITDNGRGIEGDVLDKIFIPFFTTKPEGSGIGLSLSKQIMRLHGGTLTVSSDPGDKTVFSLRF